jgi:hypothetical protein
VRASAAALVQFFVFTLHALQLDGQNLIKPSQWTVNNSAPVAYQYRSLTPPTKSFAIVKEPRGIAFDGANLWVANDNNVTELRASDGVVVRTVAVRGASDGVMFDGANIWVVESGLQLEGGRERHETEPR